MPGLIDTDTGLRFGDGLIWLTGGLGGDGLDVVTVPADAMLYEDGVAMLYADGVTYMLYETAVSGYVPTYYLLGF